MKEMKTLTLPNGITYEIVDDKARKAVNNIGNDNKRSSAPPITKTASGVPIAVNDSAERPLNNLRLFGKTEQVTTTGKQLINLNQPVKTTCGITFTPNEDGSISISGTAVAEAYYIFDNGNNVTNIGTELTASVYGCDKAYMVVGYFKADNTVVNDIITVGNGTSHNFTYPTEAAATRIFLGVNNGATVNTKVYPMVRLASISDDSFESYSGGAASPRPDWPQELNSVENPTVNILGKNLIPYPHAESDLTRAGITYDMLADGSVLASGTSTGSYITIVNQSDKSMYLEAGIPYTLSGCPSGGSLQTYYMYIKIGEQTLFDIGSGVTVTPKVSGYASVTAIIKTGITVPSIQFKPQVEMASTATSFEPYKSSQTLALNRTLPGIPVASGGNYTDSNGQQWICDEIDFERGVYIQRVGSITVDNSMTYYYNTDNYFLHTGSGIFNNVAAWETRILSTHFRPVGNGLDMYGYGWFQFNSNGGIRFRIEGVDSVEALSTWLETNTPIAIYPLAIPVETALTKEELAAFDPLYSHNANTTVMNDYCAGMEIKYTVDTKKYIDACIAENVNAGYPQAVDGNGVAY